MERILNFKFFPHVVGSIVESSDRELL